MRSWMAAIAGVVLAAGCTAGADGARGETEQSAGSTNAAEWSLSRETSGMDGETLTANRVFSFEDRRATFFVNVACVTGTKGLRMAVESFIGDPSNPEETSAFASTLGFNGFTEQMLPTGRLKIGDATPGSLGPYFYVDESFSNKIAMNGLLMSGNVQFPMIMEVSNGAGTFELNIDSSPQVEEILDSCGMQSTKVRSVTSSNKQTVSALATPATEMNHVAGEEQAAMVSPSFDCAKAGSAVEHLICSDAKLARLDVAMAANYKAMMASNIGEGARDELKSTQRDWIKARNRCADADCLSSSYKERLDAVCDYPVISGVHPECTYADDVE